MKKGVSKTIVYTLFVCAVCGTASPAFAANSGGMDSEVPWNPSYIGADGGSNNEIYFDDNSNNYYYVIGGYIGNGNADNNSVEVSGSTVDFDVYGGYVDGDGNASNNSVEVSGSTVDYRVYGGYVKSGNASDNSVEVSGSTVGSFVYGGFAYGDGNADNNSVVINSGSTVNGPVYGGYIGNGNADYNSVVINSGSAVNAFVYGGRVGNGNADYNSVVINSGSAVNAFVYGGRVGDGNAAYNSVVINSGSTVNFEVFGGYIGNGNAAYNIVEVSDSTVRYVFGGYVGGNGNADNNSVVINSGSTVNGSVYGGYAGSGEANNNTVILAGNSDLTNADIYGTNLSGQTGNKLVLADNKGITVKSLNNFNSIEIKTLDGATKYSVGNKEILLTANSITECYVGETTQSFLLGVAVEVKGDAAIEGNNITFTVKDIQASRQTAITTEARAGVTAFVNQGAEAIADNLNILSQRAEGVNVFAAVSGNSSKYDTGSYADINGWNIIVGIANTKEIGNDTLNIGVFFENGSGNYSTYNEIEGASFSGEGSVLYNGGGVLARLDKENGFYTEAAVRAGIVTNELNSCLTDALGNSYGAETENAYYGAHIGIGKIFRLDNGMAWDVYGKFFHMHHKGDSVEIAGNSFDFDSVDSSKLRIGARVSKSQSENFTSYCGLAWDYELNGDVKGTAAGYDMHTPSLRGGTVIGEAGFRFMPGKESPWHFDANVKGYAGIQEGFGGGIRAMYSF